MEQQASTVPLLDQEYLRINFHEAGFSYLLPEILELFYGQSRLYLQNIDQFFHAGDLHRLSEEAHSLKGTAGSVGAAALAVHAAALEHHAVTADHAQLQEYVMQLHLTGEQTQNAITSELARLAAENDAALDLL